MLNIVNFTRAKHLRNEPCQVSVSVPTWNKISFLDVDVDGTATSFGVFGYTGSGKAHVGYNIGPDLIGAQFVAFLLYYTRRI